MPPLKPSFERRGANSSPNTLFTSDFDRSTDLSGHRVVVAIVRDSRRLDPTPGVETRKVDPVASPLRQLFQIEELSSSVAVAKGVNMVDISHDPRRGPRELGVAQPPEKIHLLEAAVNIGHAGFDEPAKLKLAAALGDLHHPHLTSPIVDILEQMPVNGAKVVEIETS